MADWGYTTAPIYLDSGRNLIGKYGVNKSQFFLRPGLTMRALLLNSSRPLFKDNPSLRRAVNLAVNRRELSRTTASAAGIGTPTDQLLPSHVPGFRDARITTRTGSDVRRAKSLASGHTRDGKAIFYVPNFPPPLAFAQLAKRQLAEIGLDVQLGRSRSTSRTRPTSARWGLPARRGTSRSCSGRWTTSTYAYVNRLLDARFIGGTNLSRFDSSKYNRLMRQAARLEGADRYRRYGELDVDLARNAAPLVPVEFFDEPTLVSKRVGCIVLRPVLDLTAACLKP